MRLYNITFILFLLLVLVGCSDDENLTTYHLTGRVSKQPLDNSDATPLKGIVLSLYSVQYETAGVFMVVDTTDSLGYYSLSVSSSDEPLFRLEIVDPDSVYKDYSVELLNFQTGKMVGGEGYLEEDFFLELN